MLTRTEFKRKAPVAETKRRTKKCKVKACRKEFEPKRAIQPCCSITCEYDWIMSERARKARKERQEGLRKLKTKADHIKDAQIAFNAYIRLRDQLAGHLCISSGLPLDWSGNNVDAGHYRSRGSAPHLHFNEDNVHAQSKKENRYNAGNAIDYRLGLIARIGLARVEALEADQEPRRWTVEELIEIKQHYKAKLKALTNQRECA